MVRKYRMQLAPVPNLGIPARLVAITEVKIPGTSTWMLIAMEEVLPGVGSITGR